MNYFQENKCVYFYNLIMKMKYEDEFNNQKNKTVKTYSVYHLFKTPNLRFKTLTITFVW